MCWWEHVQASKHEQLLEASKHKELTFHTDTSHWVDGFDSANYISELQNASEEIQMKHGRYMELKESVTWIAEKYSNLWAYSLWKSGLKQAHKQYLEVEGFPRQLLWRQLAGGWGVLSCVLCPARPRPVNSTVRVAKNGPRSQRTKCLLVPPLCRLAEKNIRGKKTQRSLSVLQNFPRSTPRGGRQRLSKKNMNMMKQQRRVKCSVIEEWRTVDQLREGGKRSCCLASSYSVPNSPSRSNLQTLASPLEMWLKTREDVE